MDRSRPPGQHALIDPADPGRSHAWPCALRRRLPGQCPELRPGRPASRLLGIGLPLTIDAGARVDQALFGGSGLWVAALMGAIVAPTDAALGAASCPTSGCRRVRRLINVESGLNDGIVTPFVNLFLAGALTTEAVPHARASSGRWSTCWEGPGSARRRGRRRFTAGPGGPVPVERPYFRPLAVLGLALAAYVAALLVHTNGFVAAFVAGMAFGTVTGSERPSWATSRSRAPSCRCWCGSPSAR